MSAGWSGGISDYMSQRGSGSHRPTNPDQDYSSRATGSVSASLLLFDGLSREFGVMAAKHSYSSAVALNENARRQLLLAVAQFSRLSLRRGSWSSLHSTVMGAALGAG